MSLDSDEIFNQITQKAAHIAGNAWNEMRQAATVEFEGLARRIVMLVEGFLNDEITKSMAQGHLANMRYHVIATIAMLTMMTQGAVERIVNGALTVVRDAINKAAGFALIA